MLMNPTTLRLVYDNELRTPADEDTLTLPELLAKVSDELWSDLSEAPKEKASARKPWLSSLRRNIQQEHLQRLIDLTLPSAGFSAAYKPISNLAVHRLRKIQGDIEWILKSPENLDEYSSAHLHEAAMRIKKALDADYIYNTDAFGGGGFGGFYYYFQEAQNQE